MPDASSPQRLPPNTIEHFYAGGGALSRFRGADPGAHPSPEDWVGSATTRFGEPSLGLSRLEDGSLLRDRITADPLAYLGPEHVEAFGTDPGLLVKLLDAAARLIVHAHPDRTFARHHLGSVHGKTEAWIVLSEQAGDVYVGFSREVGAEELAGWVSAQDSGAMLGALNVVRVERGDSVLVPAGVPHAIGAGVFVVELQEPTDFSIALEHPGVADADLGLGWPLALEAIDRSAWDRGRIDHLRGPGLAVRGRVLPAVADPFFRAETTGPLALDARAAGAAEPVGPSRGAGGGNIGRGFAVLVVLAGSGELVTAHARRPIRGGETWLLPFAAGPAAAEGDAVVLACRPPAPGPLTPARPAV
jgi:mannose-6-phosphate isomerase